MKKKLIIILILFAASNLLQADETYDLSWKFKKGDVYIINYENNTETTTIVKDDQNPQGKESREISKENHEFQIDVRKMSNKGTAELLLTINSFVKKSDDEAKKMLISASKDKDKKKSDVNISSKNEVFKRDDVKKFFKDFVEAILDIKILIKISDKGIVLQKEILNDPFDNIKTDTLIVKMILNLIKKMISPEDIASSITAELFTQLPKDKVAVETPWDVKRSLSVIGIDAVGNGSASIKKIKKNLAVINESISYKADTTKFSKTMEDIVRDTFFQATGKEIDVKMDFKIKDNFKCDYDFDFDFDKGYNTKTVTKNMVIPMAGKMNMKFGERTFMALMAINVVGSSSIKCSKK